MDYSFSVPDSMNFHMSFPDNAVRGHGVTDIVVLTQEEYDSLELPDEHTIYIIQED